MKATRRKAVAAAIAAAWLAAPAGAADAKAKPLVRRKKRRLTRVGTDAGTGEAKAHRPRT